MLTSLVRVASVFPPPLVSRMKGMREDLRYWRDSEAPGIAVEERRRTPSMSKANAKFGILWLAGWDER